MITFRRKYIDAFLKDIRPSFQGIILDIGGEKNNNRSRFTPPLDQVETWTIINLDPETGADLVASADDIPLQDQSADGILMTELLEHVPDPDSVLTEAARLLKPNKNIYITMPFLYQVHGDPHDYTRWTADALKEHVSKAGFDIVSLNPMGGLWAVIYDLIRAHLYRTGIMGSLSLRIKLKLLKIATPIFSMLEHRTKKSQNHITTGWALIAQKREGEI